MARGGGGGRQARRTSGSAATAACMSFSFRERSAWNFRCSPICGEAGSGRRAGAGGACERHGSTGGNGDTATGFRARPPSGKECEPPCLEPGVLLRPLCVLRRVLRRRRRFLWLEHLNKHLLWGKIAQPASNQLTSAVCPASGCAAPERQLLQLLACLEPSPDLAPLPLEGAAKSRTKGASSPKFTAEQEAFAEPARRLAPLRRRDIV